MQVVTNNLLEKENNIFLPGTVPFSKYLAIILPYYIMYYKTIIDTIILICYAIITFFIF